MYIYICMSHKLYIYMYVHIYICAHMGTCLSLPLPFLQFLHPMIYLHSLTSIMCTRCDNDWDNQAHADVPTSQPLRRMMGQPNPYQRTNVPFISAHDWDMYQAHDWDKTSVPIMGPNHWYIATLVHGSIPALALLVNPMYQSWAQIIGTLVHRYIGSLVHWLIGTLVSLVHCSVGTGSKPETLAA